MAGLLNYSIETYAKHIPLILLFSISFVIAILIPIFAAFPTYSDLGGIFLRSASILQNLDILSTAVIAFSVLFSLLFLSFAIVAINVIVKHSRTHTKITKEVLRGLENYTGSVFTVLLLFTIIVIAVSFLCYNYGITSTLSSLIGFLISPLFFYAPASIVVDEKGVFRSMKQSAQYFFKRLDYAAIWFVIAIALMTIFDVLFIAVGGTALSGYILLVFNALFIMPFLVVLQSQAYMGRFSLLKG